ncbi:EamA family transporter [Candidatus Methylopumilus universalis]|uniref:EamA family transporter n=1 Tax=Candidatus Methylopumilus universalis TaxID=2588536 RepID=UPI00294FEF72|nr:EamA family transporter [Candidatus Methylopumilus universalis]
MGFFYTGGCRDYDGDCIKPFFSTLLVQFGVTQIKAVEASSFFLFEIVVAAISSYFLIGEIIALQEWLGGILIIAGVILASKN